MADDGPQGLVVARKDSTREERVLFFACLLTISITSQTLKPAPSGISLSLHCSATKRQHHQMVVTDSTQKWFDPKTSLRVVTRVLATCPAPRDIFLLSAYVSSLFLLSSLATSPCLLALQH